MIEARLKKTLSKLIAFESITPDDQGCQLWLQDQLARIGFDCTPLAKDNVDNFWACYGSQGPTLAFAGHTDVVSTGKDWDSPPFELTEKNGRLIGRGAADMKGALAAFLIACEDFLEAHKDIHGRIAWIITSAEEGNACHLGTPTIMQWLKAQNIQVDYCLVGEPSCEKKIGDLIRIGRRGSLSAKLRIHGKQGHVAYPHLANNPIHQASAFINSLTQTEWDQGNAHFPQTTLQITHMIAGESDATNVIPADLTLFFNLRFSTESSAKGIQDQVEKMLDEYDLNYDVEWRLSGEPFITSQGRLLESLIHSIQHTCGEDQPILSTGGGTSDGRYIAPYGIEVVEFGLCNDSIHQVNEHTTTKDMIALYKVYYGLLKNLLT